MESFLQNIILELDLENFGIIYESLVPFTCDKLSIKKYTRNHDSCIKEFSELLAFHILKTKKKTPENIEFQTCIENIASFYWDKIVEENREYEKIRLHD